MMMCGCRLRTNGGGGFTPPPARSARVISASHAAVLIFFICIILFIIISSLRLWTQAPNRAGLPACVVFLFTGCYLVSTACLSYPPSPSTTECYVCDMRCASAAQSKRQKRLGQDPYAQLRHEAQ